MLSFEERIEELMELDPSLSYEEAKELVLQEDEDDLNYWDDVDENLYDDGEDLDLEDEDDPFSIEYWIEDNEWEE